MILDLKEREKKLLKHISESDNISVAEMSEQLGVSVVTVRSDLNSLADKGLIIRTHGGASPAFHPDVMHRQKLMIEEKSRIARKAASMIRDGDTIMIEAGTTTALIVKYLLGKRDIQIVTNSTLIIPFVRVNPGIRMTIAGGEFRPSTESVVGPIALEELSRFHVRYAFVGTDGFTAEKGLTTHLIEGAEIVKKMASLSETTVLVADSTKYGRRGFVHVLPVNEIQYIITDEKLSQDAFRRLGERGIQIDRV